MKIVFKAFAYIIAFLLVILASWFLFCACIYRLSFGKSNIETEGVVHYKFLEINLSNRQAFEELIGNKIARIDGFQPFYVSKKDHSLLWPENPHEMYRKGYTIKAKIRSRELVFGGLGKSEVVSVEVINGIPIISK